MRTCIYLVSELRSWLDLQDIDGDTIGSIRRACFVPWDSKWNSIVRDETAKREKSPPPKQNPIHPKPRKKKP